MSKNSFGLSTGSLAIIIILICFIGTLVYVISKRPSNGLASNYVEIPSSPDGKGSFFTGELRVNGTPYSVSTGSDGNLVIYKNGIIIWSSQTGGKGTGPYKLYLLSNGNLVFNDSKNITFWETYG
jgi:hypothetical protein